MASRQLSAKRTGTSRENNIVFSFPDWRSAEKIRREKNINQVIFLPDNFSREKNKIYVAFPRENQARKKHYLKVYIRFRA